MAQVWTSLRPVEGPRQLQLLAVPARTLGDRQAP